MAIESVSSPSVAAQFQARPPADGAANEVRQRVREDLTERPQQASPAQPQRDERPQQAPVAALDNREPQPTVNATGQTVGRILNTTA